MTRNIFILLAGLLLGAVATAYFLGASHSRSLPGTPLKPPDAGSGAAGTVAVSVDEKFFESILGTIYTQLGPPHLKLSQSLASTPIQPTRSKVLCAGRS